MEIVVILIVLILIGIVGYILNTRFSGSRVSTLRPRKTSKGQVANSTRTKWRSVKIRPGLTPCKNASEKSSQVFLAVEAPIFPLEGCTRKKCLCKYEFLTDRRSHEDRREYLEHIGTLCSSYKGDDRRRILGRRLLESSPSRSPEFQA